jgi:voltage-gated potassium channel
MPLTAKLSALVENPHTLRDRRLDALVLLVDKPFEWAAAGSVIPSALCAPHAGREPARPLPLVVQSDSVGPRGRSRATGRLSCRDGRTETGQSEARKVADESRLERQLDRAVARATTPRGAAIVIATASTVMTVVAGLLVTVLDSETFPSIGSGLWWAVQTVTTVGYGDVIPQSLAGRLVAALVMLLGIGFLTVITASITSTFVSRSRHEPSDADAAMAEQLRQIDSRLERIEAALSRSSSP